VPDKGLDRRWNGRGVEGGKHTPVPRASCLESRRASSRQNAWASAIPMGGKGTCDPALETGRRWEAGYAGPSPATKPKANMNGCRDLRTERMGGGCTGCDGAKPKTLIPGVERPNRGSRAPP